MPAEHPLFAQFKEEHREIRDTVYALVAALREGRVPEARRQLDRLNRLAGPHFRYEEETMYPALRSYFPRYYIDEKIKDHDGAIETGRYLAPLLQQDELTPQQREEAAERALALIIHVSDCDGVAVIMERLPEADLVRIAANREEAYRQNVPLLEWAQSIRGRAA